MSFFSTSSKISAVFDIGNGSIGVALVKFSTGMPATIIYTYREPITFLVEPNSEHLVSSMLKLLKSVSAHLQKTGFAYLPKGVFGRMFGQPIIHDVYCVFASPWCHSATTVINSKKRRPTLITQAVLDEIADRPDSTAASANKTNLTKTAETETTIEKKIINVTLNGYKVAHPIGKRALEIEMSVFSSTVANSLLEKIDDVITSSFHFKKIHFFSYAFASWIASTELFPAALDFLFFDVSGEATDVSIIVDGVLQSVKSFPRGRATILRAIVENMKVSPDVALSFLTLTLAGKAEDKLARTIKEISQKTITAWIAECNSTLKNIQQTYVLPQAVFMTVDDDVAILFCDAIRSIHSPELSIPHSSFNLVYMNGDTFRGHNQYLTMLVPDPFLSLESVFLTTFLSKNSGKII